MFMVRKKEEKRQVELNNLAYLQKMEERNSLIDADQEENNEETQNPMFNLEGEQNVMRNSLEASDTLKKKKELLPTSTFALADKMAEDIREKEI